MSLYIIEHGDWKKATYTPSPIFDNQNYIKHPEGTVFTTRVSDGVDWYEYSRTPGRFLDGSVLMTSHILDNQWLIQGVYNDWTKTFPASMKLIEVLGITDPKPWDIYQHQIYDPITKTIAPSKVPLVPLVVPKTELLARMTDAEVDAFDALLSSASSRAKLNWSVTTSLVQGTDQYNAFKTFLEQAIPEPRLSVLMP